MWGDISYATHTYPGLRLRDGTWIPNDSLVETFVLKKTPHADADPDYSGEVVCDPWWFVREGSATARPVRFKGIPPPWLERRPSRVSCWMRVYCLDYPATDCWQNSTQQLLRRRMNWEVRFTAKPSIKRRVGGYYRCKQDLLNRNVAVIRLRMYWVLRGIVTLKRLLLRVRMRRVKRRVFIRATYWGHPKCAFSRFSGTINTPVKQRIYACI